VRTILRLSLYQLLFLDKIPARAAIDQGVRLTRWAGFDGLTSLVNAVLRNILREGLEVEFPNRTTQTEDYLVSFYSYPRWLVRRWLDRFGLDETEELLQAGNARPVMTARVNTFRTTRELLVKRLEGEGVSSSFVPHCDESVELRFKGELRSLSSFQEGLFTIQDTSSTLVGKIPEMTSGMVALDLCAAPGGKCTHLAERALNSGIVLAVDSSLDRMKLLVDNRNRLGLDSILFAVADGRSFFASTFDLVLVDAPCTGTGVLSRRTDLRWRLKQEDITVLTEIQLGLLENASTLVKPGGNLLYSTCSLEPEENLAVVERFLETNSHCRLETITSVHPRYTGASGCLEIMPHRHSMDGMFACLMKRG
jgi:16S rRNA (cytosine967-C5)-methyltransferase